MKITAQLNNVLGSNQVTLRTNESVRSIDISSKASGYGSSVNGGELLFLALATCYCNDIYREAAKKGIKVSRVEVEVSGDFGLEGAPVKNVTYLARVAADASEAEVRELMEHTDQVSEVQNSLRQGTPVTLSAIEVLPVN